MFASIYSISRIGRNFLNRIRLCAGNDPLYVKWMGQVKERTIRRYWIKDSLFYFKWGRIIVPQGSGLCKDFKKEAHDTPWAGHSGVERMLALLYCVYL